MTRARRHLIGAVVGTAVAIPLQAQTTAPSLPRIEDATAPRDGSTERGLPCDSCDVNCDGNNDGRDIQDFVTALLEDAPADCSPCAGNLNASGGLTAADIGPLVLCLLGGDLARICDGCLHVVGTDAGTGFALRLRFGLPFILDVDFGNDGVAEFAFDRGLFNRIHIDARRQRSGPY